MKRQTLARIDKDLNDELKQESSVWNKSVGELLREAWNYRKTINQLKNKKGNLADAVTIGIFLVILAIFAYPLVNSLSIINSAIQNDDSISASSKSISSDLNTNLPLIIEGIFLLLLLAGYVGAFVLAFFIDTQPAFFVVAALFFTGMILVIPMLANTYDAVTNGQFAEITNQFKIIPFILENYLQITLVMWSMIILGVYAKRSLI